MAKAQVKDLLESVLICQKYKRNPLYLVQLYLTVLLV